MGRYINARSVDSVSSVLKELGCVDRLGIILFSGDDIDKAYLLTTYLQGTLLLTLILSLSSYGIIKLY